MPFQIATRKSPLALTQAQMVSNLFRGRGIQTDLLPLVTTGDKMQKSALSEVHLTDPNHPHLAVGKGLFVKEIQEALLSGKAHIAVHSMKDLPIPQTTGLSLAALLPRANQQDALILSPAVLKETGLCDISQTEKEELTFQNLKDRLLSSSTFCSGQIGTTSARRQLLVKKHLSPKLDVQTLRGNVDTRLNRVRNNEFSAILLAVAGLERLSLSHSQDIFPLPSNVFIPAAAQGVIAIEVVKNQKELFEETIELTCKRTCIQAALERLVLFLVDGDCSTPVGACFDNQNLFIIWEKERVVKETTIQIDSKEIDAVEILFEQSQKVYSVFFESLCQHPLAGKIKKTLLSL